MKGLDRIFMDRFLDRRCEESVLTLLSILSSAIYMLPIDKKDFRVGAWTPLNINHENVILKYISRAVAKSPENAYKVFIEDFGHEEMMELCDAFDEFYAKEPLEAHNCAIYYNIEAARLSALAEVLDELGEADKIVNLTYWLDRNPVETAEEDWS